MKQTTFFTICLILINFFFFSACKDCEPILVDPGDNPAGFDCENLMLNIGDPCDDNNPETANDSIETDPEGNCICIGEPINDCLGNFLSMKITTEGNNADDFIFNVFTKPKPLPFQTDDRHVLSSSFLPKDDFNTQFSTYDPVLNIYWYYMPEYIGTPEVLFKADLNTQTYTEIEAEGFYAAPQAINGKLYGIRVHGSPPTKQLEIVEIDQITGSTSVLLSENINYNSPLENRHFTSTNDGLGNLYFFCFTNMVKYNLDDNSIIYHDIYPNWDGMLDNSIFYGAEYHTGNDQVLLLHSRVNDATLPSELVAMNTSDYSISGVFPIGTQLNLNGDVYIDPAFYATCYSECDNTYHISELVALEPQSGEIKSYLIDIDLDENEVDLITVDDFYYGIECSKE